MKIECCVNRVFQQYMRDPYITTAEITPRDFMLITDKNEVSFSRTIPKQLYDQVYQFLVDQYGVMGNLLEQHYLVGRDKESVVGLMKVRFASDCYHENGNDKLRRAVYFCYYSPHKGKSIDDGLFLQLEIMTNKEVILSTIERLHIIDKGLGEQRENDGA